MKKYILAMVLMLLSLLCDGQNALPLRSRDQIPFRPGEKVTVSLHYKWGLINADVGSMTFTADTTRLDGRKVWHTRAFGQSVKLVEAFFKLREDYQSWMDYSSFEPLRATRNAREGNYWANDLFEYDWEAGVINATLENKSKGRFTKVIPVRRPVFDVPSILYLARNLDLTKMSPDVKYRMPLAVDDAVHALYLRYIGPDELSLPGIGRVRALKVACSTRQSNAFSGKDEMFLWFSDDAARIPVYMEITIRKGYLQARLTRWEGLSVPLEALVKSAR